MLTYVPSKTSLNRPTMGPTLNDPFKGVIGLRSLRYNYIGIVREWSICGGGLFERFFDICTCAHMYIFTPFLASNSQKLGNKCDMETKSENLLNTNE